MTFMRDFRASLFTGKSANLPPDEKFYLRLALLVFLSIIVMYGTWEIWRVFLPLEISPNEAWNGWHIRAAMGSRPLYPDTDALIANNYPPLWFYLVGFASKVSGIDPILTGRLISLAGLAASIAGVAVIIHRFGGSRTAVLLGAIWCLAMLMRFSSTYIGMNDPNLLGLGIMTWALVIFLKRYEDGKSTAPGIALMVVAGFVKHSLVAIPASAILWLWIKKDYREAVQATLWSTIFLAAAFAASIAAFGWNFIHQIFEYHRFHQLNLFVTAKNFIALGAGLLFSLISMSGKSDVEYRRFLMVFLVAGLIVNCIGLVSDGVSTNATFELIVAIGIAFPLALDGVRTTWLDRHLAASTQRKLALLGIMGVFLLPSTTHDPYLFWTSPSFHAQAVAKVSATDREIGRLRARSGPIFCPVMTVCFRAGKAFTYDPFALRQRVKTGYWSTDRLNSEIEKAGIKIYRPSRVGSWH